MLNTLECQSLDRIACNSIKKEVASVAVRREMNGYD